ncbi:hypothetical protein FQR65_LT17042 [Abscondita terminalis]|nr:hypothetical protein FQR65_LT17042 [Abscondita terminalis]
MFTLVRFVLDNVYFVCKSKDIKNLSYNNTCRVRWTDGYYYSAIKCVSYDSEEVLQDFQKNLELNLPVVELVRKHDIEPNNSTQSEELLEVTVPSYPELSSLSTELNTLESNNKQSVVHVVSEESLELEVLSYDEQLPPLSTELHNLASDQEESSISSAPVESIHSEKHCNEFALHIVPNDYSEPSLTQANYDFSTLNIIPNDGIVLEEPYYFESSPTRGDLEFSTVENIPNDGIVLEEPDYSESSPTQGDLEFSTLENIPNDGIVLEEPDYSELSPTQGDLEFSTVENIPNNVIVLEELHCSESSPTQGGLEFSTVENIPNDGIVLEEPDYSESSPTQGDLEFSTVENIPNNGIVLEELHCSESSLTRPDLQFSSGTLVKSKKYLPFLYNRDSVITPSYKDHERANVINMNISNSEVKGRRRHFCIYCKKIYAKFSQHLEISHRNEAAVKMFLLLPAKNIERRKIIETIRRRGDFEYNTSQKYQSEELLVARRSHSTFSREAKDYLPCPHCAAFFFNRTLRNHVKHCSLTVPRGGRSVKTRSRALLSNLHPAAGEILKTKIFPVLRDDNCVNIIRYDILAIVFGNFMCSKYASIHHHDMIRSRLRSIGRLLISAKTLDNTVKDFVDLLTPSKFDVAVAAIKQVGGVNENNTTFKAPTTVLTLSTLCKQASKLWASECIKTSDTEGQRKADDFLSLLNVTFPAALGKTAVENRLEHQRHKFVELPSREDVKKLVSYLRQQRRNWFLKVRTGMANLNYAVKQLASFTLVSLMVFNRRRPGELERITLKDFSCLKSAQSLSSESGHQEESNFTKRYKRFVIRGKLNRTVPVLVDFELEECMNLIIANRKDVGLGLEFPYVFAYISSNGRPKYLRAYILLRSYAEVCGALKSQLLRSTYLRKQIATECALEDMAENVIHDVANFMGHHINIHNNIYRMPVEKRDITRISKILEQMQGGPDEIANTISEVDDNVTAGTSNASSTSNNVNNDENSTSSSESEDSLPLKKKSHGKGFSRVCSSKKPWSSVEKRAALHHFRKYMIKPPKIKRNRWSSPMKRKLNSVFVDHFDSGTLPSLAECLQAIDNNMEFQRLNAAALKTAVANEQHRRSREKSQIPLKRQLFK